MIRRGKSEGWLSQPAQSLPRWGDAHGALFAHVNVATTANKGAALLATSGQRLTSDQNPLLTVPRDLIVCRETILTLARSDAHLREALDASDTFAQTARGAIFVFLLLQATRACPQAPRIVGVSNALGDYIKYLPLEMLPTFWNDDERSLLQGLSLEPALAAKLGSLRREFDRFRDATGQIDWCREIWWHDVNGLCTFDDWLQLDAMYRSRALEFPGIGDSMVPCIDMANHASGDATDALYECDQDGSAVLLLRDGKEVEPGAEVTITYGDEKGACEMVFSYGFLEANWDDARDLFLDLQIPDDDPLKMAKRYMAASAPGVRIYHRAGQISWSSDYVWLVCVNEEDGLDFRVVQTVDGSRELQAWWGDDQLQDLSSLRAILEQHPLWDVFHLRATATLHERVLAQLQALELCAHDVAVAADADNVRAGPRRLAAELRRLETRLLEVAAEHFAQLQSEQMASPTVLRYLDAAHASEDVANDDGPAAEDFS